MQVLNAGSTNLWNICLGEGWTQATGVGGLSPHYQEHGANWQNNRGLQASMHSMDRKKKRVEKQKQGARIRYLNVCNYFCILGMCLHDPNFLQVCTQTIGANIRPPNSATLGPSRPCLLPLLPRSDLVPQYYSGEWHQSQIRSHYQVSGLPQGPLTFRR